MSRKSAKSNPELTNETSIDSVAEYTINETKHRQPNPMRAKLVYGVYLTVLTQSTSLVFVHDGKHVNGVAVMDTNSGMIEPAPTNEELIELCQKRMKKNHGTVKLIGYIPYFSGKYGVVKALVDEFIEAVTILSNPDNTI